MRKGWELKSLGELATKIGSGATPRGGQENYKSSGISLIRSMNVHDEGFRTEGLAFIDNSQAKELNNVAIEKNDILLNITGASVARCCLVPETILPARVNQHVSIIRLKENILLARFLHYALTSIEYKSKLLGIGEQGSTRQAITKSQIESFLVEFPKSLSEQRHIVSILDEAFAAIEQAKANLQRNLQNAKDLFQSELNSIFTNKGEGWVEKKLGEVVDSDCTLSYGIVQPGDEFQNGLPVIRPTDLTSKYVDKKGLKLIDPALANSYKRTTLTGRELLLCVRGNTGVVSVTTDELKGANVTRGIVPIVFERKLLSLDFGYYLFISPYIHNQIKGKTYGAALMQINIGDLRKISMIIPPISVQQKIVAQLDILSTETKKLETIYQQKLNSLEELKKSILQKAFSGELTINHLVQ